MLTRIYTAEDLSCTQTISGNEELWVIKKIGNGKVETTCAVYLSYEKYNQLKDYYLKHLGGKSVQNFPKRYRRWFIEAAKEENFQDPGGFVAFFVLRGEGCRLVHTPPVTEIQETD